MKRTVEISLEKAREWYCSGDNSLKEVALQAFEERELMVNPWESIKTYEDACRVLDIDPDIVELIYGTQAQNTYKLQIVKRALNGDDWEPKLDTGDIYYPWLKCYLKSNYSWNGWNPIADFKSKKDNTVYTLAVGDFNYSFGGLCNIGRGFGGVDADRGILGCKTQEIAIYFGLIFGKLIFDTVYGQYNNYEWLS